jgi:hypothetical protein
MAIRVLCVTGGGERADDRYEDQPEFRNEEIVRKTIALYEALVPHPD